MVENISDVAGAIQAATQVAGNVVSTVRQLKSDGAESEHVDTLLDTTIDLRATLLDVQAEALESQRVQARQEDRIRELERQIAEYDNWEREKSRYELASVGRSYLYILKQTYLVDAEPRHYICPHCYQDRRKAILFYDRGIRNSAQAVCGVCDTRFNININTTREHGVF